MGSGPDDPARALAEIVADGDAGLGLQVAVSGEGRIRSWAVGTDAWGRPLTDRSLHPGYCATKPVLALTVGTLVAEGVLGLGDDIGDGIRGPVTVADVLAHRRSDLALPTLTEWRMADAAQRSALWRQGAGRGADPRVVAYSEVVGWTLLASAVAEITGLTVAAAVAERVLDPLGLSDDVVLDVPRLRRLARKGRLSVPVGGLPVDVVPLLSEVTDPALADCGPALGGFVTARGLAQLHDGALGPQAMPHLVQGWNAVADVVRPVGDDATLRQAAGFRGGLMTDLDRFGIDARLAAGAVGHVGAITDVVGFHAPTVGVSVGIVGNGLGVASEDLRILRRRVTRVLADDLAAGPR